jgi:putative AlgH/UPF0301 family transcriptional regulator
MSEHEFRSLQGCFLTAANHLRNANFFRSVVLLEHTQEGAMGLVINQTVSHIHRQSFGKLRKMSMMRLLRCLSVVR